MRRIPRKDANHSAIVRTLQSCGAIVHDCAAFGGGFPDIMTSFKGRIMLLEIKDGSKSPSARKLTPDERRFHLLWSEHVAVVENEIEAMKAIGAI